MAGNDDQQTENSAEELETADEAKEEPVPGDLHEEAQEQPESGGFFDQKPTDNSELSLENIQEKKSRLLALKSKHQKQIVIRKQLFLMFGLLVVAVAYVVIKANPFKENERLADLQSQLDALNSKPDDGEEEDSSYEEEDTGAGDVSDDVDNEVATIQDASNEPVTAVVIEKSEEINEDAPQKKSSKRRQRTTRKLSKSFVDPEKDKKKKLRKRIRVISRIEEMCAMITRNKNPALSGRWEITFKVYSSGVPTELKVKPKKQPNARFEKCIRKKIASEKFEPIPNEDSVKRIVAID